MSVCAVHTGRLADETHCLCRMSLIALDVRGPTSTKAGGNCPRQLDGQLIIRPYLVSKNQMIRYYN